MKKLIKTALILLIPGGMLFAQTANTKTSTGASQSTPAEQAQIKSAQLNKELQLGVDQKEKVFNSTLDYYKQLESYNNISPSLSADEQKSTLKQISDNYRKNLNDVLTIAQQTLYNKLHSDSK